MLVDETCDGKPESYPKIKEKIAGHDVWLFLHKFVGNFIFGGHTYFNVESPCEIPEHRQSSLRGRLTGKLLTWADSAFDLDRAKAVKDMLNNIIADEFNTVRDTFEELATEELAEKK